ncbi:MAG: hypothetical protein ACK4V6_18655, partial [Microthrixaceae bacterium]
MGDDALTLELDGHEVRVTHPDKVFFPAAGHTKADLVQYYVAVAEPLLRAMGGRPVLLERYPDGAGGKSFFQKRVPKGAPQWRTTTQGAAPNRPPHQSPGLSGPCHYRGGRNLHLHRLRGGARLAGPGRKRETGDRVVTYEIRDDPDDLPIPCATFAEAERRGRRRAARIGSPV